MSEGSPIPSSAIVSSQDWGLLYGYGLFETMRSYSGRLFLLEEHIDRLLSSAAAIGLAPAPPRAELVERARGFAEGLGDRVLRVTLTAGNPDAALPPVLLVTERAVPDTRALPSAGLAVRIATGVRDERSPLNRHKTLNQLANLLAWQEARRAGYHESVFLNTRGEVAEGSRSNVFVVKAEQVTTPTDSSGILPGITRRLVTALLRDAGVDVREAAITRDMLFACDECFLTNSVMEVMPVARIGPQPLPSPVPGRVTAIAAAAYAQAVQAATASLQNA